MALRLQKNVARILSKPGTERKKLACTERRVKNLGFCVCLGRFKVSSRVRVWDRIRVWVKVRVKVRSRISIFNQWLSLTVPRFLSVPVFAPTQRTIEE
jgi:hypothetical protein